MRRLIQLLTISLALQLAVLGARAVGDLNYKPLEVGEPLPFSVSGWSPAPSNSEGHVVFICAPNCAACAALADRFAAAASDTLRHTPHWLVTADSVEAHRWGVARNLDLSLVHSLDIRTTLGGLHQEYGSIYFTPTRVVLTEDLIILDARPSDQLPQAEEFERIRLGHGIAPESLSEFVELVTNAGS